MINFIKLGSLFLQKHYLLALLIIIVICIIINTIIFYYDDIDNPHFNRNYKIINENGKDVKQYISSSLTDGVHYTLTTFTTVGYGDITPYTTQAKAWTNSMHILVLIMTLKLFEYISSNTSACQADFKEFMLAKHTADVWRKKTKSEEIPASPKSSPISPDSIRLNI
jgi:amino acid transporter